MNPLGRYWRLTVHALCGITLAAAALGSIATAQADTYAPYCEAPIAQCASDDQTPHGGHWSFQLYPNSRCHTLISLVTHGLTLVVRQVAADPHYVAAIALLLHELAHACPHIYVSE